MAAELLRAAGRFRYGDDYLDECRIGHRSGDLRHHNVSIELVNRQYHPKYDAFVYTDKPA